MTLIWKLLQGLSPPSAGSKGRSYSPPSMPVHGMWTVC